MERAKCWLRNLFALAGVFSLGFWLASARTVKAQGDDVQFQLESVGDSSSLMVYQPSTRTVYVYRAAMAGNSTLQCNVRFELGKIGGPIRRQNCPVQSFVP